MRIGDNYKLQHLYGLENLEEVGDKITIIDNSYLIDLKGLRKIKNIVSIDIYDNYNMTSISGLDFLENISFAMTIWNNKNLKSLEGMPNIKSIQYLSIINNQSLNSLEGLNNLEEVTGALTIDSNPNLTSINGLDALTKVNALHLRANPELTDIGAIRKVCYTNISGLAITQNGNLEVCAFDPICSFIEENVVSAFISENKGSCQDNTVVTTACTNVLKRDNLAEINYFPNPTSSNLFFNCRPELNVEKVKIFKINGTHIGYVEPAGHKIDISHLENGWYILQSEIKSIHATNYSEQIIYKQ